MGAGVEAGRPMETTVQGRVVVSSGLPPQMSVQVGHTEETQNNRSQLAQKAGLGVSSEQVTEQQKYPEPFIWSC